MGKILDDRSQLEKILESERSSGKKIVSTNGVFDVLHVGHVRYLKAARELGDILVVGLNSDACTRRLKGPTRPFVPEGQRAELLASLECVSYVVIFDETTPEELLEAIRPDIHVKGGDYHIEQMPETEVVRRNGGEIVLVPFEAGHSTTSLTERIAAVLKNE